jgi:hypothetical protein
MDRSITVGDIFAETARLFGENAGVALGSIAGLTVLNVLVDQVPRSGANFLSNMISIGLEYWLIRQALERRDRLDGRAGFGSLFGLNLLSGLAILVGFLLLIVPGIYLAARWAAADAALLSEGEGISAALGKSWEVTASHIWPIVGALLVVYVPIFSVSSALGYSMGDTIPVVISAVTNLLTFTGLAFGWLMGIAIYALLQPVPDTLAEIFA